MGERTLTIKGLPDDLYERLKASASDHRRSLNSEAIVCLERALGRARIDEGELRARIDARRERLAGSPLTDEALREARSWGRP